MGRATEKPLPQISVQERAILDRIAAGGVLRGVEYKVELTAQPEPMITRWINGDLTGRVWNVIERAKWVPVAPSEIAGGLPQGDVREKDGQVVRGERGAEILVKMPARLNQAIATAKANTLRGRMQSKTAMLQMAQNMAAKDGADGAKLAERMDEAGYTDMELNVTQERRVIDRA